MATVHKLPVSALNSASSSCEPSRADGAALDQFPAGLRVLVVDDDTTCLRILEQMLKKCLYHVTTCSQATLALSLLRERMGCFDVVISDVHMPDMDGFKLLELVGLEMDLPVIMMSADGTTSAVMRGIKHGACDYLIKPIRMEELKNIWQHVIRKKWNEVKDHEHLGSVDDPERQKRVGDEAEYTSSANEGTDGSWKVQKKRREAKEEEDDDELENDDPSTSKKPRVVWSVDLHQQFVSAVNQLGIEKAVPKRILELMNVPGLTRENVASHLQKYRLYLKRMAQHQNGIATPFCAPVEPNLKMGSLGRLDLQALAASGQIPPQAVAALHAELLGRPTGSLVLPGMDHPILVQASIQGPKCIPAEQGVAFSQPLLKCQPNTMKQFPQTNLRMDDTSSALATWPPNHFGAAGPASSIGGLNSQNTNMLVHILQQRQQQQQQQQQQLPVSVPPLLPESNHTINVQPSCLVVPSQPSSGFHTGSCSTPANQNSRFNNNVVDYSPLSSLSSNASLFAGQLQDGDLKTAGLPSGYSIPGIPISSTVSSCSSSAKFSTDWQVQNDAVKMNPTMHMPGFVSNAQTSKLPDQLSGRNLGFVGKGTCIPSRFAVDDIEATAGDLCHSRGCVDNAGDRVKQEHNPEFTENMKVGISTLQHYSSGDLMGVLSK